MKTKMMDAIGQKPFASIETGLEIRCNGNHSVTVRGYHGAAKSIVLPDKIDGLPLAIIGKRAFKEKGLEYMLLPEGISTLEDEAFSKNPLDEAILPGTVRSLGIAVFYKNRIQRLQLPRGLKTIGDFCFYGCAIEKLRLPACLETIGVWAFGENPLREVVLGANVVFGSRGAISGISPGFDAVYEAAGRRAGKYVLDGEAWRYEGRD
jgi:hypothetical protein